MKKLVLALLISVLVIMMGVQTVAAAPSASCGVVHVVRPGENLFRIALRYGTTIPVLQAYNGIANSRLIYVGQRIAIPCGSKTPPPRYGGKVHVVSAGQTLSSIARWYGVSVYSIVRANHIRNPNLIYVGQRLVIPSGWTAPPPSTGGKWYTVRPGDTLYGIARYYGVNMWSIAHANSIRNPSLIYVGQKLYIP